MSFKAAMRRPLDSNRRMIWPTSRRWTQSGLKMIRVRCGMERRALRGWIGGDRRLFGCGFDPSPVLVGPSGWLGSRPRPRRLGTGVAEATPATRARPGRAPAPDPYRVSCSEIESGSLSGGAARFKARRRRHDDAPFELHVRVGIEPPDADLGRLAQERDDDPGHCAVVVLTQSGPTRKRRPAR